MTFARGCVISMHPVQVQFARHPPHHGGTTAPSHCSSYSTTPLPHVATSHASPTPSPSVSTWSPFGTSTQLSRWSGMPSPSVSGLAGTMALVVSQAIPGGQSWLVVQVPCSFLQAPESQNAPALHGVIEHEPTTSRQRPVDVYTVPLL